MWSWERDSDKKFEEDAYVISLKAEMQRIIDSYKEKIEGDFSKATFAFDWSAMRAFSIERMMRDDMPVTVIGYLVDEPIIMNDITVSSRDVVAEWTFECSHAEHQRLVAEFVEYTKWLNNT